MSFDAINRAKETGYVKYMMANPIYFEDLNRVPTTLENVINEYRRLEKNGLMVSAAVSPHCSCPTCINLKKYRRAHV